MTPAVSAGNLLVATPALRGPGFSRTVVLVLEANDEGVLGVVLNRPGRLDLAGALPDWAELSCPPDVVFSGGPVTPTAAICLGRSRHLAPSPSEGFLPVLAPVGVVDLTADRNVVGAALDVVRFFSGYAGWGAGQLQAEIELGSWYVVDSLPGDPFTARPERLWREVLRRQPGELAWVANCPLDPSLN